jgi:hypothetical protein
VSYLELYLAPSHGLLLSVCFNYNERRTTQEKNTRDKAESELKILAEAMMLDDREKIAATLVTFGFVPDPSAGQIN